MRGRQAGAGAAAERRDLRGEQPEHLGHDPGADGEIVPAQAEHQRRDRHCDDRRRRAPASGIAEQRMHAGEHRQREQQIGAEADIGLLADRDEAGIAGEQVPQARQRDIGVDFGEQPQVGAVAPRTAPRRARSARSATIADADAARRSWRCSTRTLALIRCTFGNRPSGRSASTTRNAIWPASRFQPGSSCAPMACATPRMMPPASVPHMLPSPPMITASKPKISRAGPIAGSKLARTASSTPATATMASDSAIASPKTWRVVRGP